MPQASFKAATWLVIGGLLGGLLTAQLQAADRIVVLPLAEMQQLATVFSVIRSDYVEPVDEKKLITDAIAGMVGGLDPHSQYLDKKALKDFKEDTQGRFVGVGIEITQEDGLIKIITPIEGSPAFRAGLQTGDLITKINTTSVRGLWLGDAVKLMRGQPSTQVTLTIFRKSENRSFPVTLVREQIKTQSVRGKLIEPGYAWVRLSQFQYRSLEDFCNKLTELSQKEPKLKGLVLDLRNNPGGLLDAAVGLSAAFLPPDVTVVSTKGQLPQSYVTYKTSREFYYRNNPENDPLSQLPAIFKTLPMVVLINEGSASASEIVAGALQDYQRATLMGSQTFGKGSVQTLRPVGPDTALKLTIAYYFKPNGESIQAKGVVPDIWLDDTEEGDVYSGLRTREADLGKHLGNPQDHSQDNPQGPVTPKEKEEWEKRRAISLKKLESEATSKKPKPERKPPEYGSEKDFQLTQALRYLKGQPVKASTTLSERKPEPKPGSSAASSPTPSPAE